MKPHYKIISAVVAFVLMLAFTYFVFTHPQPPRALAPSPDTVSTSTPTENPGDVIVPISKPITTKPPVQGIAVGEPYPITVQGSQVCLPLRDPSGIHTMICAIGIKTTEGKYYALHDTDPEYKNISSFSGEGTFEIKGVMHPKSDPTYISEGMIEVASVKKI